MYGGLLGRWMKRGEVRCHKQESSVSLRIERFGRLSARVPAVRKWRGRGRCIGYGTSSWWPRRRQRRGRGARPRRPRRRLHRRRPADACACRAACRVRPAWAIWRFRTSAWSSAVTSGHGWYSPRTRGWAAVRWSASPTLSRCLHIFVRIDVLAGTTTIASRREA